MSAPSNHKDGEDENSVQKRENLKMEGLLEKMLSTLESFISQASVSASIKEKETLKKSNSLDSNQPKLF